jgi:hypothetical protein
VKISDLLGEGWEADEPRPGPVEPEAGAPDARSGAGAHDAPEENLYPGTGPDDAAPPPVPTSARAQLAELAANLAPAPAAAEPEPERSSSQQLEDLAEVMGLGRAVDAGAVPDPSDVLGGLGPVVDDLLPGSGRRR